jgi:hypothetical protein
MTFRSLSGDHIENGQRIVPQLNILCTIRMNSIPEQPRNRRRQELFPKG